MNETTPEARPDRALRRTVLAVALFNLGYFGIEFGAARVAGSVALFADSIDFLEDASVNLLIALALGWSARRRGTLGMGLALLLLIPAVAAVGTAASKFAEPVPPAPLALGLVGMGALAVNVGCAFLLARFRTRGDSLTRAAFLSARNDALANVAIVATGWATALTGSAWPDVAVGLGIALLNADAAREVWQAARRERRAVS